MWHGSHWAPSSYGFPAVGSGPTVSLLPEGNSLLTSYRNPLRSTSRSSGPSQHMLPYKDHYKDEQTIAYFPHSLSPLASGLDISLMAMAT